MRATRYTSRKLLGLYGPITFQTDFGVRIFILPESLQSESKSALLDLLRSSHLEGDRFMLFSDGISWSEQNRIELLLIWACRFNLQNR